MLRRVRKLLAQPAFQAEPARVLARGARFALAMAARGRVTFNLTDAGERMRAPATMRYTSLTAYLLRDWVEPDLRELQQLLKPGDVFIDVGANVGLFTLKGARLVGPTGCVIALEPSSVAHAELLDNLALNAFAQVTALKVAASNVEGFCRLNHVDLGGDPQAFSLVNAANAVGGETVETMRLDTLAAQQGLARIDLIKIDVEGAEPMVVEGALGCLAAFRPAVLFECNAYINAGGEADAADRCWALLQGAGYRFFRLKNARYHPIERPPADFCNVLAVHKNAAPPFEREA
jgi:FkbM family methyltransferase